jgi:hypothetical protein
LTEEQLQRLEILAAEQGRSISELIRQSVDEVIKRAGSVSEERRRRAVAAAGRFRSGQADISTNHDSYLAEAHQQ